MSLDYSVDNQLENFAPVLDEQADWFGRLLEALLFPAAETDSMLRNQNLEDWLNSEQSESLLSEDERQALRGFYETLQSKARELNKAAGLTDHDLEPTVLHEFIALHKKFYHALRHIEHRTGQSDIGFDPDTGLRSGKAMDSDLKREMARRERQGSAFCLVLGRIDDFDKFSESAPKEQIHDVQRRIAEVIKACGRGFDDAYTVNENEFVMSLKHAEAIGGRAAVNRLRKMMKEADIAIESGGERFEVTMSYCVAEPAPGDDMDEILANMRADLDEQSYDKDFTLEYVERSPLERYLSQQD